MECGCDYWLKDKYVLTSIIFLMTMAFWHSVSSCRDKDIRRANDLNVFAVFVSVFGLYNITAAVTVFITVGSCVDHAGPCIT